MTSEPLDSTRKMQLLKAASKVIADRGFADTRLVDVADEVGISAPLVVYYFGTRENLLTEALRYTEDCFYDTVFAGLGAITTARGKLAALLLICCSTEPVMDLPQGWALWFEVWNQAARNPRAARNRSELDNQWRSTVADIVRDGQNCGEFVTDLDADRFAVTFTSLLDGLAVQIALNDETVTPSLALDIATTFCTRFLGVEPAFDTPSTGLVEAQPVEDGP